MADDKRKKDPSTPSANWERMAPKWKMIESLLGGTPTLRNAGELFLPKHQSEPNERYKERVQANVLVNMFDITVERLTGKVFNDPVIFDEGTPSAITQLEDDIDGQGNDLSEFARIWFRDALQKGFSHALIDFPAMQQLVDGDGKLVSMTLADERAMNRRPYWVHVPPENIIAATAAIIDGVEVLTSIRILEEEVVPDGFAEAVIRRIRMITPGQWRLFRQNKDDEWELEAQGEFSLPFIPLVTFYTNRQGLLLNKPPLEDLAHMNIRHWQSNSDQIAILTVARFPILAASGVEDTKQVIGPHNYLITEDPTGKWYYVEHDGAAIEAGRKDLEDLENLMGAYGADMVKRKAGGQMLATVKVIDEGKKLSQLEAFAIAFKNTLETAMEFTGAWFNIPKGSTGTINMNTEFDDDIGGENDSDTLIKMRGMGDITRKTHLEEQQRRGILNEDLDIEKEVSDAEEEAASLFPPSVFNDDDDDKGNEDDNNKKGNDGA